MTASAAQTTPGDDANPRGDLARKIDHLLKTKHPENRGPYSMREAAALINKAAGDEVLSHSYLGQLRSGKRDNPTMRQLAVLSVWFGVDVGYFFPDEISQQSAQNIDLADAIKDPEVRDLALSAAGLPKVALKALRDMVDTFWTLEKRARGQRVDGE